MEIGEDDTVSSGPAGVAFRLRWDVFLSFRGEDTRHSFIKDLYDSLQKEGVRAFRDDDGLNRGDEIAPSLVEAIEDSAAAIVVFSRRYAESRWCLEELAKICECPNKLILPVFHRVDPSDVRRQMGPFEEHFRVHEKLRPSEVLRWRSAMEKVGGISGCVVKNSEKSEIIQSLVKRVLSALNNTPMGLTPYPVGLDSRTDQLMELVDVKSNGVRVLGIHGTGGVGKTTLAKALFNKLVGHFELRSFISNVREVSSHYDGEITLQNKLIGDLSNGRYPPVNDVREGVAAIKMLVNEKRVLVVLDDVDNVNQLNALMSKKEWFYVGSRIIITTRDTKVLLESLVDLKYYEVRELDRSKALQLFSYHALGREKPTERFFNLSEQIVSLTGGLPLALEVFGSMLFGKWRIEEWKDAIMKLKKIRPGNLQDVLSISYHALDEQEKCIFLDIACLFIKMDMDRVYAIDIWKGCGFEAEIAISDLTTKSLIKITENNTLWMHDQVRDMGRQIVKHENIVDCCMRSRLWNHDEIMTILMDDKRIKLTQGIVLDFKKHMVKDPDGSRISWNNLRRSPNFTNAVTYLKERIKEHQKNQEEKKREVKICTKVFGTMVNLRLLQTNYVNLEGEFKFPADLKWLQWKGCPLKYLPSDFSALGLAVLDLSDSKIERVWGWSTKNMADNLMVLNLHGCFNLVAVPNLSGNQKLEKLILGNCVSLTKIDEHIGNMNTLVHLNLRECSNLIKLPTDVSGLKRLENLILSGCTKLKELPENIGSMKSLKELLVDKTAIESLPESIFCLIQLEKLSLNHCRNLKRLPHCIKMLRSLKELSLNGSGVEELPNSIGSLANLEILSVMWCASLSVLPNSIGNLKLLTELLILASPIKELPVCVGSLPNLRELSVGRGKFLNTLPHSIGGLNSLVGFQIDETSITDLPDQIGSLKSLKKLELWKCRSLRSLPESLGSMLSLTTLIIFEAKIRELPESIGMLENLTMLKLTSCKELLKLPASIGKLKFLYRLLMENTAVTELPDSFGMLSSLIVLCISKKPQVVGLRINNEYKTSAIRNSHDGVFFPTSFSNLSSLSELDARARNICGKIPDDFEKLASLEILNLGNNHFLSLPSSLRGLSILKKLLLPHCSELRSLPPLPSSLLEVNVAHCIALENISDLSNLESLEELNLTNCEKVEDIPGLEHLKSLKRLYMNCCHTCSSVAKRRLAKGSFRKIRNLSMPGSKIPNWFSQDVVTFSERKNRPIRGAIIGVVVSLNLQIQDDLRHYLPGIVDIQAKVLKQDFPIFTTVLNLRGVPNRDEDQVHLCRYSADNPLVSYLQNGYKILVEKRNPPCMKGVELKKWGLCLVYEGDDDFEGDEESLSVSQQSISEKLAKFFGTFEEDDNVPESHCEAESEVQETYIRAQTTSSNQVYLLPKFIALSFLLVAFSWFYLRIK